MPGSSTLFVRSITVPYPRYHDGRPALHFSKFCPTPVNSRSPIALKPRTPAPCLLSRQTMTHPEVQILFTYGTLRDAYASLPDSVRCICPPTVLNVTGQRLGSAILPAYTLHDIGSYPGVLPSSSDRSFVVHGDLFTVSPDSLCILDEYEGCSSEFLKPWQYLREAIDVIGEDGQPVRAWVYVYNWPLRPSSRLVPHGDYVRWLAELAKKDVDDESSGN